MKPSPSIRVLVVAYHATDAFSYVTEVKRPPHNVVTSNRHEVKEHR